jgi:hypothetical protein
LDIWVESGYQNSQASLGMLDASLNKKLQSIIPSSSDEDNILPEFDNLDNILGVSNVKSTGGEGVEAENTNLEDELAIDDDDEPMTYTFAAITLANTGSAFETKLYNSGVSPHMSPYKHKVINSFLFKERFSPRRMAVISKPLEKAICRSQC